MPPEAVEVASAEHACLLCGIAFYDCHSWSAHAVRAHKFRSKAVRLAVGLRCRACGARFATLKRHQRHLINYVRCCQAVERDLDCLLPVDNSEPGHVQTVFEGAVAVDHLPAAGPEISVALLLRLRQEVFSSDCEIFAAVQSTVEPFPVLRNTLAEWIEGLPDTSLRAWAKDVLLCMQVDLHCQVASRVPRPRAETPDVFTPLLEPLPLCPAWNTAPVLLVGFDSSGLLPEPFSGNCAGAVSWHFWQGPPDSVDFSGASDNTWLGMREGNRQLDDARLQLAAVARSRAASGRKIVAHMLEESRLGPLVMCYQAWTQFLETERREHATEENIRGLEKELKVLMDAKKAKLKNVLTSLVDGQTEGHRMSPKTKGKVASSVIREMQGETM
eukprot:s764_g3.t1